MMSSQQTQPSVRANIAQAKRSPISSKSRAVQKVGVRQAGPSLLEPLVDPTKSATADVPRKRTAAGLDRADVVSGGTDITADVQNGLNK